MINLLQSYRNLQRHPAVLPAIALLSYLVQAAKTLLYQVFILRCPRSTSVLQHIRVADILSGCVKERHGSRHEIITSNQKPNSVNHCVVIL